MYDPKNAAVYEIFSFVSYLCLQSDAHCITSTLTFKNHDVCKQRKPNQVCCQHNIAQNSFRDISYYEFGKIM